MKKFFKNTWVRGIGTTVVGGMILWYFTNGESINAVTNAPCSIATNNQNGTNSVNCSVLNMERPVEKPDGIRKVFTFQHPPSIIVSDSMQRSKIQSVRNLVYLV